MSTGQNRTWQTRGNINYRWLVAPLVAVNWESKQSTLVRSHGATDRTAAFKSTLTKPAQHPAYLRIDFNLHVDIIYTSSSSVRHAIIWNFQSKTVVAMTITLQPQRERGRRGVGGYEGKNFCLWTIYVNTLPSCEVNSPGHHFHRWANNEMALAPLS